MKTSTARWGSWWFVGVSALAVLALTLTLTLTSGCWTSLTSSTSSTSGTSSTSSTSGTSGTSSTSGTSGTSVAQKSSGVSAVASPAASSVAEPWVQPSAWSSESARAWIAKQVAFGPRVPGTRPHRQAGDFLLKVMRSWESPATSGVGAGMRVSVREQAFEAPLYLLLKKKGDAKRFRPQPARNLWAAFAPEKKDRVILAAHWDTRARADKDPSGQALPAAQGAIDGASGVAVLLEVGRILSERREPLPIGVDLVFLDHEDQGVMSVEPGLVELGVDPDRTWCVGSQVWAKQAKAEGYQARYGILLDMVAAKGAVFPKEGHSQALAGAVQAQVWTAAKALGYGQLFVDQSGPPITDDHVAIQELGIPMVDIIDLRLESPALFADYHHTRADALAAVDPDVLSAVGRTILQVLGQTR